MPKRTKQQEISDEALAAIQSVIAVAGFAVEQVANDYGEDLLVQTSHAGQIDASRLWVQAKGTRTISSYTRRDGRLAISVGRGHLTRWARSADPVVVVLWDCAAATGYYTQIKDRSRYTMDPLTATVHFERQWVFDVDAVTRLAWVSRIEHYQRLMLAAREIGEEEHVFGAASDGPIDTKLMRTHYAIDLLCMLGLLTLTPPEQYALSEAGLETFSRELVQTDADETRKDRIVFAAMVTVVTCTTRLGVSMPTTVVHETVNVLHAILEPALRGLEF
jgi:Domain of unknown function (DUF4365)